MEREVLEGLDLDAFLTDAELDTRGRLQQQQLEAFVARGHWEPASENKSTSATGGEASSGAGVSSAASTQNN
eukprot:4054570-Pyramimonas_sp.AAC.1